MEIDEVQHVCHIHILQVGYDRIGLLGCGKTGNDDVLLVVALYTFINLGNVLRGFAKHRRATVLLKTDKNVVMVTMMTSLYNLQTLMLAAYSYDKSYTQLMTMTTGLVIIVITIGLALWMIIESRHKIKQLANNAG